MGIKNKKAFGLFGFASLVVTSIVGADIYVISTQTAQLGGIQSLFAWILGGLFACIIGICIAQCAELIPESGGIEAYAEKAFGQHAGFIVGFTFYIAEWVGLIAFPLAFVQYISYFIPTNFFLNLIIKIIFMGTLTAINLFGPKIVAKIDTVLTLTKIAPLIILIICVLIWVMFNHAGAALNFVSSNSAGAVHFSEVMLLVFWAYAGFEMSVLASGDVQNPKKTIPLGIIIGIIVSTVIYLLVNLAVFFVLPKTQIVSSNLVLVDAISRLFQSNKAGLLILFGGILSITGVTFAVILELSDLLERMAQQKNIPSIFARKFGKDKIPYFAVIVPSAVALLFSFFTDISTVASLSVVILAVIYGITGLAHWRLHIEKKGVITKYHFISLLTICISIFLFLQGKPKQYIFSILVVMVSLLWYYLKHKSQMVSNRVGS